MIEQDVIVNTKYGRQPGFRRVPGARPARIPPIILYMDAPGFRDELQDPARRIAQPRLLLPRARPVLPAGHAALRHPAAQRAMSAVIRAAMQSLTNTAVADDTAGMIAFLDGQDKVEAGSARLRRALHERPVRDDRRPRSTRA